MRGGRNVDIGKVPKMWEALVDVDVEREELIKPFSVMTGYEDDKVGLRRVRAAVLIAMPSWQRRPLTELELEKRSGGEQLPYLEFGTVEFEVRQDGDGGCKRTGSIVSLGDVA
jgi:hypothetical protein